MKSSTRVTSVTIDGQEYLGIEIDMDLLNQLDLQDGELLDTTIEDGAIIMRKTGIIETRDELD